ncbi:MAG: hypothetical protein HZB38_00110 [Planctomycetes bacterium]|nr:hypothetical protein [Planctomycetota bacterium]
MQTPAPPPASSDHRDIHSLTVLGARVTWVFLGPLVMLLATAGIVVTGSGWLTGLDALFGIIVVLMLLGRWIDHRRGTDATTYGDPATPGQFRRYMTILPIVAAGLWAAANLVGNHLLS